MISRNRTLAALIGAATVAGAVGGLVAVSVERHLVRGESMKPSLQPRDTAISIKVRSPLGRIRRPRVGDVAVIELPWEHDLVGIKRLVAGPETAWEEGSHRVAAGPGWVAVGDQRTLSTDSRHHGRVPDAAIRGVMIAHVSAVSARPKASSITDPSSPESTGSRS